MPAKNRQHYRGDYQRRAAAVRAAAYGDAGTKCWRCGLTLTERRVTHPSATWDAGHVIDGDPRSPLRAECSPCNRSSGAAAGNAKRSSSFDW